MAVDLRRAFALLARPESEWNRIVADPAAGAAVRGTTTAVLAAATAASAVGTLASAPVGTPAWTFPIAAAMFASSRGIAAFFAFRSLRGSKDVPPESATLLAGWGCVPIHVSGVLEILPVPFLRWLWVLAGLGLSYVNLATATTPVLGTSSDRGAALALRATAALAVPVVAFDLLRHLVP
jgi:hypothetical protein